jgi:hypothetical protein
MRTDTAARLHDALRAVAIPILGVSIGDSADRRTWRIDFAPSATAEDRAAAAQVVATLDVTEPAPAPVARPLAPVRKIDFLRLLTAAEYDAFVRAGETGDAELRFARALFEAAPALHLDDPLFVQMLASVVTAGVLTPERAQALIATLSKQI